MKIGLLTQYYKPEMGAPQNRLYEMVRGLKELGNELYIVTAMPNYPTGKIFPEYQGKLVSHEIMDGIAVKRYWLYASNVRKVIPRIWNMVSFSCMALFSACYLRKLHLDYLVVESPPLTLGIVGIWLAKFAKCKLIANISDIWPLSAKELGAISEGRLYRILERLEHKIYRSAHICMGQSQEIVDHIAAHGGKNVYLFRNGVDPTRFQIVRNDAITYPVKLIYAGLLGFAQGVADICKSINFADIGAELHIYGAGGEQEEIEQYLQQNPNRGIFYHGVVSRQELPKKLQEAHLTLVPLVKNIYGAVPSKIYESMAAGLPIMFIGEGEGAKIVENNAIGLVAHAKDYATLQANIQYIVSHPDIMKNMIDHCQKCAQTKFNRPQQILSLHQYLQTKLTK